MALIARPKRRRTQDKVADLEEMLACNLGHLQKLEEDAYNSLKPIVIAPAAANLDLSLQILKQAWSAADRKLPVAMHVDGTRVAAVKAYDDRRKAVVGGTMEAGQAVIEVQPGTTVQHFMDSMQKVVPVDTVTACALSLAKPGVVAQEVALLPYRHVRNNLDEQQQAALPGHDALREFEYFDRALTQTACHFAPYSIGCDCGTEGSQVMKAVKAASFA